MNRSHSLNLKLTPHDTVAAMHPRTVTITEVTPEPSSPQAKAADRLMISARENVRFLNNHLQPFSEYLELPPMVENTLYLAYTVRVRDNAPFDPVGLKRWLTEAGIEVGSSFAFSGDADGDMDERSFCLGCHQYLTIPDLAHIVETFESFFTLVEYSALNSSKKRQ
jgi:hypothetical protein